MVLAGGASHRRTSDGRAGTNFYFVGTDKMLWSNINTEVHLIDL